jgi:hypothetical protein
MVVVDLARVEHAVGSAESWVEEGGVGERAGVRQSVTQNQDSCRVEAKVQRSNNIVWAVQ